MMVNKCRLPVAVQYLALFLGPVISLLAAGQVLALGLDKVVPETYLGEPFSAHIPILLGEQGENELENLRVRIVAPNEFGGRAANGIYRKISAHFVKQEIGYTIHLRSDEALLEPIVEVMIEVVSTKGRFLKEYVVLLDPPPRGRQSRASKFAKTSVYRPTIPPLYVPTVDSQLASAVATGTPNYSGRSYGPVIFGETLSSIAKKVRPAGLSLEHTIESLLAQNPEAFVNGSINRLIRGVYLEVPDVDLQAMDMLAAPAIEDLPATSIAVLESSTPGTSLGPIKTRGLESAPRQIAQNDAFQQTYGPVKRGETLSQIVYQILGSLGPQAQSQMLAILANNSNAFIDQDINRIKEGATLRLWDETVERIIVEKPMLAIDVGEEPTTDVAANDPVQVVESSEAVLPESIDAIPYVPAEYQQTDAVKAELAAQVDSDVNTTAQLSQANAAVDASIALQIAAEGKLTAMQDVLDTMEAALAQRERENGELKTRLIELEQNWSNNASLLAVDPSPSLSIPNLWNLVAMLIIVGIVGAWLVRLRDNGQNPAVAGAHINRGKGANSEKLAAPAPPQSTLLRAAPDELPSVDLEQPNLTADENESSIAVSNIIDLGDSQDLRENFNGPNDVLQIKPEYEHKLILTDTEEDDATPVKKQDFDQADTFPLDDVLGVNDRQAGDQRQNPLTRQAAIFMAYGDYPRALKKIQQAIKEEPDRDEHQVMLISLYAATKNYETAKELAEQLLDKKRSLTEDIRKQVETLHLRVIETPK